jgi:ferredoxin-NADP reductase
MLTQRMKTSWTATRATVARRLFLDRQAVFWRRMLWDRRARVLDIVRETADTKTFVLDPGPRWRGHRAGQYTTLKVELDGVRTFRCYSISSAPSERTVALTIKRLRDGRVSQWLHDRLCVGDVVGLGAAAGEFVLPDPLPPRLLFVSGGSGITPIMSMLRDLACRQALHDVVVVHHARRRDDVIFGDALETLACAHAGVRLVLGLSDDPRGRFDEQRLAAAVPDFADRAAFVCGPPGLMTRVEAMWDAAGAGAQLRRERFVAGVPAVAAVSDGARVQLSLAASARSVDADTAGPLLEQLERAGVRPAYGCRMGICHTCRCRKRSGSVQNLVTGAVSSAPDEDIQLCVSVPRSDLELVL